MNILIGENIKRLRKTKNITQEQLAEAMNVSIAAVSKWERSETYPDITVLSPLAYYFSVSIDELMGYDESKIDQEIDELLIRYHELYQPATWNDAGKLIRDAYKKYPNDYRIMHWYMWHIAGGSADNDIQNLLHHKEEFTEICNKILHGCTDIGICFQAYTMLGKLLWADGKYDDALALYRGHFLNWYESVGQKSEQLFAKNTPEFLYWVKRNLFELIGFAADKVSKSIFFDNEIPYAERIKRIESYGDAAAKMHNETGDDFLLVFADSIMGRLANDLKYRGGTPEDTARVKEKSVKLHRMIMERSEESKPLRDMNK